MIAQKVYMLKTPPAVRSTANFRNYAYSTATYADVEGIMEGFNNLMGIEGRISGAEYSSDFGIIPVATP